MELKKYAMAGTLESSDISIAIQPNDKEEIEIDLDSSVSKQFGRQTKELLLSVLKEHNIKSAKIKAVDKGAIDYVIKARLTTAIFRSCESNDYKWEAEIDG
ncbi:MAG TPA: citrate lyase acyl carrier protein [Tissierellaceae bacterium]